MSVSSSATAAAGPRSVALIGPYGSGKSTLFEALLAAAGSPLRKTSDPRNRTMSTELRLGQCTFLDDPWSILDCPGSIEFAYETSCALAAVDLAIIVCEPTPERLSTLPLLMRTLEDRGVPHLVFVNKIDTLATDTEGLEAALQAHSKFPIALRQIPIREGDKIVGYVDVVRACAYRYGGMTNPEPAALPESLRATEAHALAHLTEVLADQDDVLLEKVLDDIEPTRDELYSQIRKDQASGTIVEVLVGSALQGHGIQRLWKALRHDVPAARTTAARLGIEAGDQPLVQVFKTVQSGKLAFGRIWRGVLRDGASVGGTRVSGIARIAAGEQIRIPEAGEGEIVAIARLDGVPTGTMIGASASADAAQFPEPPFPVFELAIATKDRKDDVKLSAALHKLVEEDPSLSVEHNLETGETLLHGQGEIHLGVALERLASLYNLAVTVTTPKTPYKETIKRIVTQHSRLKRQTGGHGQFADVKLEIAPRPRGEGFAFADKIVGGAVPKQYIPAVQDAAEDAMQKGPFGHPVVDVGVTLLDGTFHSVDSSDMAFKTATRMGVAEALAKAEPVLLEPIDHVTATVPSGFTSATQRLLSGRRGQILGYSERPGWPGWDEVEALVPAAELHDLIMELRSDTMGLGSYRRRFDHLAEARGSVAEKLLH
jgi:elongation factor G